MSTPPISERSAAQTVAGFLSAAAIFMSLIATVYRPVRIAPFAIAFALIAVGMERRTTRLGAFAVAVAAAGFTVGMTIAVLTQHPLF